MNGDNCFGFPAVPWDPWTQVLMVIYRRFFSSNGSGDGSELTIVVIPFEFALQGLR